MSKRIYGIADISSRFLIMKEFGCGSGNFLSQNVNRRIPLIH